jgi:N-acetylneuraminic acid mutarotase
MNSIKQYFLALFLCAFLSSLSQGVWVQKASLDSFYVQQAVGFAVNGKGYSVGGPDCLAGYAKQVLEYDPVTNTWKRLADFPGDAISGASGFSIGDFGYCLTGRTIGNNVLSNQLWEFNPFNKTWTRKADLPGEVRSSAFAFSIDRKGYVGTGYNSIFDRISDFWEWDQQTNTWSQKANFPGKRSEASGFSIDGKGYAGLGSTDTTSCSSEFYEYNLSTNSWSPIATYPGGCSIMQSVYTICNKAYVGAGLFNDPFGWYEYDAAANTWTQMANVPGPFRKDAFAFAINKKGYIGTGAGNPNCNNDFYEFSAPTEYNCNMTGLHKIQLEQTLSVYPNPFIHSTTIENNQNNECKIEIRDVSGALIRTIVTTGEKTILDRGSMSNGVYFLYIIEKQKRFRPQKLVLLAE